MRSSARTFSLKVFCNAPTSVRALRVSSFKFNCEACVNARYAQNGVALEKRSPLIHEAASALSSPEEYHAARGARSIVLNGNRRPAGIELDRGKLVDGQLLEIVV